MVRKGVPLLPSADIVIDFDIIIDKRQVTAKAVTNKGAHELTKLNSLLQEAVMMKTITALISFIGLLLVSSAVAHANTSMSDRMCTRAIMHRS